MKITAPQIVTAIALLAGGCSLLATADRTKIHDDLYMPSTFPEAGTDSGGMAGSAGGAGSPITSDAAHDTGGEASTEDASLEDAAGEAAVSSDAAPEAGEAAAPRDGGDAAARDGGDAALIDVGVSIDVVDATADTGG